MLPEEPSTSNSAHPLATNIGLSSDEAIERQNIFGKNQLPKPRKDGIFRRFLRQFQNVLIYVLLFSAVITASLGQLTDTFVILAVVLINAIIGVIHEGKAEKSISAIRHLLSPRSKVYRDGILLELPAEDLVPGDVVEIKAGDKVPADLKLLKAHGLMAQEAILTGESVPVEKYIPDSEHDENCSRLYSGTIITNGKATAEVVATGQKTELGRISGLLAAVQHLKTPLIEQMEHFAGKITGLIIIVAGLLLLYGYWVEHLPFRELFMAIVGLSVAAIPEGLPAVLTITMAIGVYKMARRKTLVRLLPSIETLGAVAVICTDKTGTLTENKMHVETVVANDRQALARTTLLCNDASLSPAENQFHGDPMEQALLSFGETCGFNIEQERQQWRRTDVIPFDAGHRFMASLHHNHQQHGMIFIKGAPEQILSMCSLEMAGNDVIAIDKEKWHKAIVDIASKGQRVLAFAIKQVPEQKTVLDFDDLKEDLVFQGLIGLIDPPRPETPKAVQDCYQAGIEIKMITGDHSATAIAIAKAIGLRRPEALMTGLEIEALSEQELVEKIQHITVFARTRPEHKLRLVKALQSQGLTVAMTGDGVNDAPALKRAEAGIAMGLKGSAAAREAAEMVLMDDNFASIVDAIREGRTVYDNLKKVISWTLPTSTGEAFCIIIALLLGLSLPVTPVQILWINLITVTTLGMTLAFEPTEENSMKRAPRSRNEPLLSARLAWHTLMVSILFALFVFGVYFYALYENYSIQLARSMAMNMLVILEIFQLFFIRNIHKPGLNLQSFKGTSIIWLAIGLLVLAQAMITYLPAIQAFFDTEAIPMKDNLILFTLGGLFFILLEMLKKIRTPKKI